MRVLLGNCRKSPFEALSANQTIQRGVFGNNSGNLLFQFSTFKMLSGKNNLITLQDYVINKKGPDFINENFDIYVLPLANLFYKEFISCLDSYSELIEKLKIPVVVIGVGTQASIDGIALFDQINNSVKRFCRAVLARSASIGVRGEFTANYLKKLGFRDILTIGCPSMFLFGENLPIVKKPNIGRYSKIAFNYNCYLTKYWNRLRENIIKYPNISFFSQSQRILETILYQTFTADQLDSNSGLPPGFHDIINYRCDMGVFLDISTWMSYIKSFEFSFGTRIHGNIIALLSGVPAHVIAHDSRTLELVEYFEIPHTKLSMLDNKIFAEDFAKQSDYTNYLKNHQFRFDQFVNFLDQNNVPYDFSEEHQFDFNKKLSQIDFPRRISPKYNSLS